MICVLLAGERAGLVFGAVSVFPLEDTALILSNIKF